MVAIVPFLCVIRMGINLTTAVAKHGSNVMKSVQHDRLLSANEVINLIFKIALRLIKRVYRNNFKLIRVHIFFGPFSSLIYCLSCAQLLLVQDTKHK